MAGRKTNLGRLNAFRSDEGTEPIRLHGSDNAGARSSWLRSDACGLVETNRRVARENCVYSDLGSASIRWIVDDATAFVKRELKRNVRYEAIILDPPTYGHGAKGTRWEIHRHLLPLLNDCWQLLSEDRRAVLLSGHSSHIAIRDINAILGRQHGAKSVLNCEITQANLVDSFSRKLDCGFAARYSF